VYNYILCDIKEKEGNIAAATEEGKLSQQIRKKSWSGINPLSPSPSLSILQYTTCYKTNKKRSRPSEGLQGI
jgi:hypothetical protein